MNTVFYLPCVKSRVHSTKSVEYLMISLVVLTQFRCVLDDVQTNGRTKVL